MLMLPTLAIEQSALAPSVRWHVASAFARRGVETAGGQSLELALLEQGWLARKPYLRAASGKSGPFFALPIEAAALATGRDAVLARALGDAALTLGALFQVRDDILDLFGDKGRGQVGNDLREGKVSALTVTHLEHCPQDRDALLETLRRSREETGTDEVRLWSRRFVKSGALARACAWASSLVEELVAEPNLALEPELRQLVVATAEKIAAPLSTLATD